MLEVFHILWWAELHVSVLSAVFFFPVVENWKAVYLSRGLLDQREWSLHLGVFSHICLRWGMPDVDLLASCLNRRCRVSWQEKGFP